MVYVILTRCGAFFLLKDCINFVNGEILIIVGIGFMYGFVNSGVCFLIYVVNMCCDSIGRFSVLLLLTNSKASSLALDSGSGCLGGGPLELIFLIRSQALRLSFLIMILLVNLCQASLLACS